MWCLPKISGHTLNRPPRRARLPGDWPVGGPVTTSTASRAEAPELIWWKRDPRRLEDAQTVLPVGRHLFLGARYFFSLRIDGPGQAKIEEQVTDRPRIDRINGMVRREHHVFTANKNGWINVFDVSRPADPALRGALDTRKRGGVISPHDVALLEDCLVVVDQARGTSAHLRLYRVFDAETGRLLPVEQWQTGGSRHDSLDRQAECAPRAQ